MQKNWVGRSEAPRSPSPWISRLSEKEIKIFTTRPDTVYRVTFMVRPPNIRWYPKSPTPARKRR
jgi:leucyl-tRNA synthetase